MRNCLKIDKGFTPLEKFAERLTGKNRKDTNNVSISPYSVRKGSFLTGFTLIEVSIAIAILSYVVLAVIGLFGYVTFSTMASEFSTLANSYAREKMEDIKNRSFDNIPEGTWTIEQSTLGQKGVLVFSRQVIVAYMDVSSGILIASATATDLKKIEVRVTWTERGETREVMLTSLISRHL